MLTGLRDARDEMLGCDPVLSEWSQSATMDSESRPSFAPNAKRVLMVTSALAMGGCERQILATAEGLVSLGYEIEIFELAEIHSQFGLDDEFWKLGITSRRPSDFYDEVLSHPARGPRSNFPLRAAGRTLGHHAVGLALDQAIRVQSERRALLVGSGKRDRRFVATAIGVPARAQPAQHASFRMGIATADLYRDAYRQLMHNPNLVIVNNSATNRAEHEAWLNVPSGTTNLVYNGFSPRSVHVRSKRDAALCRSSLGLYDGAPVIGTIMRFAAEKDPLLWLETAASVAAARPDAQFVLAGYGALADDIARKVEELGITDRVILPGPIVDVGSIYALMDVFLMTSRFEGVPNVLIEAQASGVPVVAPAVGGTAEAFCNGKTGLLVHDRRAPNLAGAVLKILAEPHWRQTASAYGPAFVAERFGQSRMIHETIALYGQPTPPAVELPHEPAELATMQRIRRASIERINGLCAAIDRERLTHAGHIRDLEARRHAEHDAFVARINALESTVQAERRAHADQFAELEATLRAERRAFTDHIRELDAEIERLRSARWFGLRALLATARKWAVSTSERLS